MVFVAIEESLNRGSRKQKCVLPHLLRIITLEMIISSGLFFVEIISVLLWFEWSINLLLKQGLPIVVS